MPTGRRNRGGGEDDRPTYLSKPVGEVDAELHDRIARGNSLLERSVAQTSPDSLERLRAEYAEWRSYNVTYLERVFTTRELANRYSFRGVVVLGYTESPWEKLQSLRSDLQDEVNHLTSLRARLNLYVPTDTPASAQGATPPATPAPTTHNTFNFQGQVGSVMTAETVHHLEQSIKQIDRRGDPELAEALQKFRKAIMEAQEVDGDKRAEVLDGVAVLAEVGGMEEPERSQRRGRVRAIIAMIVEAAYVTPKIKEAWDAWGPTIIEHLPRLPPGTGS